MKKIIYSDNAPKAIGPYSQAVEAGGVLYLSGQIPVNPADGSVPETIEEQTAQCFKNIEAILSVAGYTLDDVVKSTVLLDNMDNFAAMNTVYSKYYTKDQPARVCYQVVRLPLGVMIEIETIAVRK